ncbi:excitatory amino acid transporter 3-like protein [Dinothrombium tinctorium]|uniref:Amino acid transporter n=1 Tax=Dinothrombium tinctorium TaxID=1965070 RepID=A0A443QM45_9ACAR|nr:excitatory amino acid transporter 3-like protein [Dinothrombium tinctorium]
MELNELNKVENGQVKRQKKASSMMQENMSTFITFGSVLAAILIGILIRETTGKWSKRALMYLEFPGTLFLRALSGLVLPIIISSLIASVGSLDMAVSGRIGLRGVVYYFATTCCALLLGIIIVLTVRPGDGFSDENKTKGHQVENYLTTADTLLDLIRNMVPPNLIQACFAQYHTYLKPSEEQIKANVTDFTKWEVINSSYGGSTNILGLIVFSLMFGIIAGKNGPKAKPVMDAIISFNELVMEMTAKVIKLTPLGVLFLIMPRIVEVQEMSKFLSSLGWYTFTVLFGVLFHGFVVLPIIYFVCTRQNPLKFIAKMSEALFTAFGTASSSATMPITIDCLQNKLKVDERVVSVLIPIGATINMDGTALYEAVAAIFIAQARRKALGLADVFIVALTATAASVGAAGIPQAGVVTMVLVLNAVGLDPSDVSLILAVDWFLDRFRTMVNVLGDSFGAGIVDRMTKRELEEAPAPRSRLQSYAVVDDDTLIAVKDG